jgi:hypothetical protein
MSVDGGVDRSRAPATAMLVDPREASFALKRDARPTVSMTRAASTAGGVCKFDGSVRRHVFRTSPRCGARWTGRVQAGWIVNRRGDVFHGMFLVREVEDMPVRSAKRLSSPRHVN